MNATPSRRFVLFANGELPLPDYTRSLLRDGDFLIAVNGGTRAAWELKVVPHLLIGDSDSLPDHLQQWLEANAVPRQQFPRDKNATDFELGVEHAISAGARVILCIGLTGHRIDHTVANLSALTLAHEAGLQVEAINGEEHIYLVSDELHIAGEPGQTVSLLPWGGDAVGVKTEGMHWELNKETLQWGHTRGVSNEIEHAQARISLESGLLLVCQHRGEVR